MKKEFGTTVAGALVLALALTGCAGQGSDGGTETLEIWDMQQSSKDIGAAYAPLIEEFEKQHPGVTVKVTSFPYQQYRDKVLVAMKGGTGPDVLALDQVWMAEFAAGRLIAPLDDALAESSIDSEDFFEGAWASNEYAGEIWGVPLNADVWEQMYYNADMFTAAGLDPDTPPTTWDGWLDAAEALTQAPDQFGISMIGCKDEGVVVTTDSFIFSNGGAIIEDGKAVFDSPENIAALTQYADLLPSAPTGLAGACEQDAVGRFTAGKAGMLLAGSWQQDTMETSADFDWRIAVPPAPEGKTFVGALGGFNLSINAKSDHSDLAFEWVEFMSQPENQVAVNSLIPALIGPAEEFVTAHRAQPEVVLETLKNGAPRPLSPVYPAVSLAQQAAVQAIIGGADVEQSIKEANRAIEEALEQLQ